MVTNTRPQIGTNDPIVVVHPGLLSDIGAWLNLATDEMCEYWARKGSNTVHNSLEQLYVDGFAASLCDDRHSIVTMFLRKSANGEKIERKWF